MKIVLDEQVNLWYNRVIKIPQVVRVEVARGAERRQVKKPPPYMQINVDKVRSICHYTRTLTERLRL